MLAFHSHAMSVTGDHHNIAVPPAPGLARHPALPPGSSSNSHVAIARVAAAALELPAPPADAPLVDPAALAASGAAAAAAAR